MLPKTIKHYCQKCLAPNPLGRELCARCGTRLMLVVEPPTARFEEGGPVAVNDEHVLERVSALENKFSRLADKFEKTLDLLLRQAKHSYYDHALIETVIDVLGKAGTLDALKVDNLWRERCRLDAAEQAIKARREELRSRIVSAYKGLEQQAFEASVNEGVNLLIENESLRGIRVLQRAAALAVENGPLNALIGEHCFEVGKNVIARDHLERALIAEPANERVRLLLGLACGDTGDIDRSREILKASIKVKGESFAARCGLGRLLAAEAKWTEALAEFKSALVARASAEAHYAVGCVYHQLGRDRLSVRHQRKALELDAGYAAASFMLGVALSRLGRSEQADEAFSTASRSDEARYRSAARQILRSGGLVVDPKPFGMSGNERRRLITSGDKRLAQAVRLDALGADRAEVD